jgi:hypothetical protein
MRITHLKALQPLLQLVEVYTSVATRINNAEELIDLLPALGLDPIGLDPVCKLIPTDLPTACQTRSAAANGHVRLKSVAEECGGERLKVSRDAGRA